MDITVASVLQSVEETLRFHYHNGEVTVTGYPYPAEWESFPTILTAQMVGGEVQVMQDDGSSQVVAAGQALCVDAGVHHRIVKITPFPSVSRWSHFNLTILGSINLFSLLEIPRVFHGDAAQRIGDINEEMALLHKNKQRTLQQAVRRQSLGLQLAQVLIEAATVRPHFNAFLDHAHRLAPVMAYITENLHRSLSREELAAVVHLSPSRFSAIFKDAMGMAASNYVQQLRMQKAQRLLISTGLAIGEVAAQSGYESYFHFSRMFKRRYGISPSQYRATAVKNLYRG